MTQDAIVTKILNQETAEVIVTRGTACGSNCGSCESCMFENQIKTQAKNSVYALPGQKVVIQSQSSKVYSAIFLVYIMPFIFFFIGYIAAVFLKLTESGCMLFSFLFFIIGVAILVITQRRKKDNDQIKFEIISVKEE